MTEWEPATDAEVAMRDALRTDDQESYFRILAGVDLLLPVSADALAGLAPLGWGTWSTGGRTHVLAFTSPSALQACLADYTGSARRVAYGELAETWPNLEWWLAVNPGLPIEGYLPAWFVAQLSRGDLRLPTRGPARELGSAEQSPQDLQAAAMAANAAASRSAAGPPIADTRTADPRPSRSGYRAEEQPTYQAPARTAEPAYQAYRGDDQPAYGGGQPAYRGGEQPAYRGEEQPGYGARPAAAGDQRSTGMGDQRGGMGDQRGGGMGDPRSTGTGDQRSSGMGDQRSSGMGDSRSSGMGDSRSAGAGDAPVGPGGLPVRTPGAVLPSGLPSRVPAASDAGGPTPSWSAFSGASSGDGPKTSGPGQAAANWPTRSPGATLSTGGVTPASASPAQSSSAESGPGRGQPDSAQPGFGQSGSAQSGFGQSGPAQPQSGSAQSGLGQSGSAQSTSAPAGPGQAAANWPRRSPGATLATGGTGFGGNSFGSPPGSSSPSVPAAYNAPNVPGAETAGPGQASLDKPRGALPTRTPMAQTPPLPNHLQPPGESATAPPEAAPTGGLPRRQVTSADERPPSMAAAAEALAGSRTPPATTQSPAGPYGQGPQPGVLPPVIPGAGGAGRGPSGPPIVPAAATRPTIPPSGPPARPELPPAAEPDRDDDFVPANDVERDLFDAAGGGSTDQFLSTLLLATILVPVADNSRPGSAPGESGFAFRTEEIEGERFLVVFTSRDRLSEHFAAPTRTVAVRFYELIRNWPDPAWSFAVNPGSPVGAKYPGPQVIALAAWATEAGLGADPVEPDAGLEAPVPAPQRATDAGQHATVMQKTIPADQVDYYLERGYDRVAGFVHRANEVEHLHTPGELFSALGLASEGSAFTTDAKEAYVLRWPAYRPSLYRIPYGGQSEQALRAMDGWVIERPPFRGNGFAPGEGRDVIAEFKVDSVRLPHGAQLWRMDADGTEKMVAIFDADAPAWRRVGEQ